MSELASIKTLLQGIAADVSSVKTGLEMLQTTVEQRGARVTEAETGISDLEKTNDSQGASIDFAMSNLKKLQDKITVLEDAGRWNNVCMVGILKNAEKREKVSANNRFHTFTSPNAAAASLTQQD